MNVEDRGHRYEIWVALCEFRRRPRLYKAKGPNVKMNSKRSDFRLKRSF